MLEWQYIANRPPSKNWGPTIIKFVLIAFLAFLVHRSDQEHERDRQEKNGLINVIAIQARVINEMPCPGIEMGMPLGRKK
jgi:hypothetical protein